MTAFLQLYRDVARESGVMEAAEIASVNAVSGRAEKVVHWTRQAWTRVQNDRDGWWFLRAPFAFDLAPGAARYTPAAAAIDDLATWITAPDEDGDAPLTLYDKARGMADEAPVGAVSWAAWRKTYDRGAAARNRPVAVAVSPPGELCFGPVPDAVYVCRGEYQRAAQELRKDDDEPMCPPRFHDIIVWRALILLHEHDEARFNAAAALGNYADMLDDLERDQLPGVTISGPLA